MTKYNEKLIDRVAALVEEDVYTITQICDIVGISRVAFYNWKVTKPEFAKALDLAVEQREERLKMKARKAMCQKLDDYRQVETKTTYTIDKNGNASQLVMKEYVVKEKYCVPDTSVVAFALSNGSRDAKPLVEQVNVNNNPFVIQIDDESIKRQIGLLQKQAEERVLVGDDTMGEVTQQNNE